MQIDFHHTVTYVVSRLAGFSKKDANIVAYSSQYVDDAVNSGVVHFRNGAMYSRISSAHKMLDYRNFEELGNHQVWIPFHFLPGNEKKAAGANPNASFIDKIICKPDSYVARDMLKSCIADHANDKAYSLHRLGISMHVYADTWAHQNFAGVNHKINRVENLRSQEIEEGGWFDRVKDYFGEVASRFVSDALPLGHGAALSNPDKPYLDKWEYTDGNGKPVVRENLTEFQEAAQCMFRAMKSFQAKDKNLSATDQIPTADMAQIAKNFQSFTDESGDERHGMWLASIAAGDFSFGAEEVGYISKGRKSWKDQALDTTKEIEHGKERYHYKSEFLSSDWKLFHDALQAHRFDVLHDILPKYGISAA
jgi:Family of unknown function (DUF6765)